MDFEDKSIQIESPYLRAGCLSKFFTCWVYPIIRLGNARELEQEDIYKVIREDSTSYLGSQFGRHWDVEIRRNSPSLFRALYRTFGARFFWITLQFIIIDLIRLFQCVVLGFLILSIDGYYHIHVGYAMAATLILFNYFYITFRQNKTMDVQALGMNIRVAISNRLHVKALRLSQRSLASSNVGKATNLLSNDVNRYDRAMTFLPSLFSFPFQMIFSICILWYYVGVASLAGFLLTLLYIPFQSYVGKALGKLRASVAEKTDARLKYMVELVGGIFLVKISAWEQHYTDLVEKARSEEIKRIRKQSMLQALNFSVSDASHKTVIFITLVASIYTGVPITAEKVFVTLSIYNTMWALVTRWIPTSISGLSEMIVSTRRLKEFLMLDEKCEIGDGGGELKGVLLKDVSAIWLINGENVLQNVGMNARSKSGWLVGITGAVGSGKSSLLQAILGELPISGGRISVHGTLAYTPQDPWLFSGSIQENIMFGRPFDRVWYQEVIKACALIRDLRGFPFGDQTLVGDKGVTLSGGQKARISLARAVYSNADIYLLDDPLSAVDNLVGRHIMDKCITGLLKRKCVILVTHQIRYLQSADEIIVMRHGQAPIRSLFSDLEGHLEAPEEACTTVDALLDSDTVSGLELDLKTSLQRADEAAGTGYGTIKAVKQAPSQEEKEARSTGYAGWSVWKQFLRAGNSVFTIGIFWISCFVAQFLHNGSDYWLKIWTGSKFEFEYRHELGVEDKNYAFSLVYAAIIVFLFIAIMTRTMLMFGIFISSAIKLHRAAFKSVIRAPLRFFESNSMGRILNRFSNDMGSVDEAIPANAYFIMQRAFLVLGCLVILAITMQSALLAIPVVVAIFLCVVICRQSMKPSAVVKRLERIARSPVFGILSTTLHGLSVIRAFRAEEYFRAQFLNAQDAHTSAYRMSLSIANWAALWLSCVGTAFFASIVLATTLGSFDSATVGLIISTIVSLNIYITDGVIQFTDFYNEMVSVERVIEYTKIEPEGNLETSGPKPSPNWPGKGMLLFENIYVKYGNASPILSNINCQINASEKIGIVGRTGAGKSSLVAAVFRLVEPCYGSIHLDGINLRQLGLHDFRSRISFIPQNPVLFTGTIRDNLDPLKQYTDIEIWDSLEKVQLRRRILSELGADLDSKVTESGGNFSQGEKQLLCLARSLLSKNKILILDEATANVDPVTDALIQKTIRAVFKDCTVIIVAHRLDTVMDCDRICVLDAGRIVEFDSPLKLLEKRDGWLHYLVHKSGSAGAARLRSIASTKSLH